MSKSIFNKRNLIYFLITIISISIISLFIYLIFKSNSSKSNNLSTIERGLQPIKIIQNKNGKEQEANFTQIGAEVLASSLESDKPFVEEIKNNTKNIGISRIELPILPEENINVLNVDKLEENSIDNYLTNIYNIFRDNSIQPNINQLSIDALNDKTQDIKLLIEKNKSLYFALFLVEVPPDALILHKSYIRIAQVQNSFLLGLLEASSDPLKLDINNKLTISILKKLDITIKQELDTIRQKYNLIYQKQ
jgi:hypothetical protein